MLYLIFILSIIEFSLMGYDKHQAEAGGSRVPEKTLLGLGVIGGAVGGLLGMQVFRHKTRKQYFWLVFGVSAAIHLFLLASGQTNLLTQLVGTL